MHKTIAKLVAVLALVAAAVAVGVEAHEAAFPHEHHGNRVVRLADWSDVGSYRSAH